MHIITITRTSEDAHLNMMAEFRVFRPVEKGEFFITNPRLYMSAQVTMIQILQGIHHSTKELEIAIEDYPEIDKNFINC